MPQASHEVEAGGQVYVVCPLVEEGELELKSAEQHAKDLQQALPHRRVAGVADGEHVLQLADLGKSIAHRGDSRPGATG